MNLAIILAFGAMIFWGVGDFLIQRTVRKIGNLETLFWITSSSSVLLLPFVYSSLPLLNLGQILVLTLLGLIGFWGSYIQFESLKVGKISVVEVIISLELPLTVLLGVIFFHESLSLWQILLMSFLFLGIILLSVNFQKIYKRHFLEKGALLAVMAAALIAGINFLTALGAKNINPIMVIWWPWVIVAILSGLHFFREKKLKSILRRSWQFRKILIIMVILDIAAWLFYAFALAAKELSITTAITESFVVIAMFLGIIFNKERVRPVQYIGAALAIVCSILIGLFS